MAGSTPDAAASEPLNAGGDAAQERQLPTAESVEAERVEGAPSAQEEEESASEEAENEQVAVAGDALEMNGGEKRSQGDDGGQGGNAEGEKDGAEVARKEREVGIRAELQCTLCHDALFKPVTTPCGHSFCRVCLVESLLSKDLSEAQCPICRGLVLYAGLGDGEGRDSTPTFSVNVTLWNVIQVLEPTVCERGATEEEEDFSLKYDQFDAKWRIDSLRRSSNQPRPQRRRRQRVDDDDEDSDAEDGENYIEEDEGDTENDDGEGNEEDEAQVRAIRARYPQIRVENTIDGHLEVTRNIVHDRDDANQDGYHSMRLGLAIMEFPSLFQLYNEHQECSIAVLKLEEDEELDGGVPFFMSDDGEDDNFVVPDYYNEITLSVVDDAGNVVMERTRGASQGIVTFPQMRLDVPGGMYTFRFTDDLYGLFLKVRIELRENYDENDVSLAELVAEEQDRRRGRLVMDEAGERGRSRRGRVPNEDEDDGGDDSDSNDSFIVNDEDEDEGRFSGSEVSGDEPEYDEDEEDVLERIERRRMRRERDSSHSDGDDPRDGDIDTGDRSEGQPSQSDHDDEEYIVPRRVASRMRVVDDDDDSDHSNTNQVLADTSEVESGARESAGEACAQARIGVKRRRALMESDSDDNDPREVVDESTGCGHLQLQSKRLRQVTSRLFHSSDEDEDDTNVSHADELEVGENEDHEEDGFQSRRGRWIGSDPYWSRRGRTIDEEDENDDAPGDEVPIERIEDEVPLEDEEEEWEDQHGDNNDGDDFSDA